MLWGWRITSAAVTRCGSVSTIWCGRRSTVIRCWAGTSARGVGSCCARSRAAALLRPGRNGEPHQGTATGSVCRSHQLPPLMAQPVPPVALVIGLYAAGGDPAVGLAGHRTGPGLCRYPAPETAQDRCSDPAQYPAHPLPAVRPAFPALLRRTGKTTKKWPLRPCSCNIAANMEETTA